MSDKKLPPAKEHTGDVQSLDVELSNKIESAFRVNTPNFIDWYPLEKNRHDQGRRLNQYVVKPNEKVDAVSAVRIANVIVSECQHDCDTKWGGALRPREQIYQVLIIDEHRGGYARPVVTHHIALTPSVSRPAPAARDGDEEDSPITATSMLERAYNKIQDGDQAARESFFEAAGDILLIQKQQNDKLFAVVHELIGDVRQGQKERAEDLRAQRHDLAELQTVAIESKLADEDIADRRAERNSKHMLTQFAADTLKDARELLGPFVSEVLSDTFGKPQITDGKEKKALNGKTNGEAKPDAAPNDVGPSDERVIVTDILDEVEKLGLDEYLFGRVDESGTLKEPGVFTIAQMKVLLDVKTGSAAADTLDVLIPDSGNPLAFTVEQMKKARARMPLTLLTQMFKLMTMRKRRRNAAPTGEANAT